MADQYTDGIIEGLKQMETLIKELGELCRSNTRYWNMTNTVETKEEPMLDLTTAEKRLAQAYSQNTGIRLEKAIRELPILQAKLDDCTRCQGSPTDTNNCELCKTLDNYGANLIYPDL